jgi:hypothetical protein
MVHDPFQPFRPSRESGADRWFKAFRKHSPWAVGLAYCASYARPPAAVTLDIDDTVDAVHGHQQLSLFNAHHDERCFMPIHVYDIATSRPVAILLRSGKTRPDIRSDVMSAAWCAASAATGPPRSWRSAAMATTDAPRWWRGARPTPSTIFGLPGNAVLSRLLDEAADDVRVRRAEEQVPVLRR